MNHLHFLQGVRRRETPSVPALILMLVFAAATPALAQETALGTMETLNKVQTLCTISLSDEQTKRSDHKW